MRASRQVLTIMFVDVAGFSLAAEGQDPAEIFESLKRSIVKMRRIVRTHGGIVDKALGDGLLCYFGFALETGSIVTGHADQAFACAMEMQAQALADCVSSANAKQPVYPIRIGLNTAPVYIGDLGDADKVEFTVIGDGVNYAKRIEDSCDVFMIMLSQSTRAALANTADLQKRGIMIKHHDRIFDVYECNPFVGREQELGEARRAYQAFRGVFRGKPRLLFARDAPFDVSTEYGECRIVDVSHGGLQVCLPQYLARGVQIKIAINGRKQDRKSQYLSMIGLTSLQCEVKWGRPAPPEGYMHGLEIQNLNDEQLSLVYAMLGKYAIPEGPSS